MSSTGGVELGVELKGGMYTFMSLKLHTSDMSIIDERLADKVLQAPNFFKNTPVVVDLSLLENQDADIDGNALLDCIRRHKLIPIVASLRDKSSPLASSIAIPLIEGGVRDTAASKRAAKNGQGDDESAQKPEKESAEDTTSHGEDETGSSSSLLDSSLDLEPDVSLLASQEIQYVVKAPMLIDKPVRSGQQIYARDTDLIVMGQIGPGAEVIADNNIHVYGPLRGRALCGVSGNTKTRIFCQSLEAELVSVAGNYRMLETIPEELRGKPAQIWLDNDRLNIEPL